MQNSWKVQTKGWILISCCWCNLLFVCLFVLNHLISHIWRYWEQNHVHECVFLPLRCHDPVHVSWNTPPSPDHVLVSLQEVQSVYKKIRWADEVQKWIRGRKASLRSAGIGQPLRIKSLRSIKARTLPSAVPWSPVKRSNIHDSIFLNTLWSDSRLWFIQSHLFMLRD